jgi:hypothetical protein
MLRSQTLLCLSMGSLEMLVFHTLSAGNSGHFGAPGTEVEVTVVADTAGDETAGDETGSGDTASGAPAAPAVAGAGAASPVVASIVAATTGAIIPVSTRIVASWHGQTPRIAQVARLPGSGIRPNPGLVVLYSGLPWRHAPSAT